MSEWIEWSGGQRPVQSGTIVSVRHRSGMFYTEVVGTKYSESWSHLGGDGDIVAYRVEQETIRPKEKQVGGNHYKGLQIQPVEFIHANGIGFMEGNVIKYVSRWRKKNGIADLEKAKHYIELLIEMESKE